MTTGTSKQTIICQEVFDENSHPSEEEVLDYALKIGIDPKSEGHLLPIARDGLMQALPPEWKPCFDSSIQRWYYFNSETGKSQWEHPLDPVYREIVKRGRSEGYSSAGDDDSKTTAKEDLKSFDEVSDMLSSKSIDLRSSAGKQQRPLLARRKQAQLQQQTNNAVGGVGSNEPLRTTTPLQAAKLINSTFRETNLRELAGLGSGKSRSVSSTPMEEVRGGGLVLRRARTLDPISDTKRRGILRDSSFTAPPTRSLASTSASDLGASGGISDLEDERKRSVRFADFELKALDVKFQLSDSEESIYGVGEDGTVSTGSPGEEGSSDGASPREGAETPVENKVGMKVKMTPIKTITLQKSNKASEVKQVNAAPVQQSAPIHNDDSPSTDEDQQVERIIHKTPLRTSESLPGLKLSSQEPLPPPTITASKQEQVAVTGKKSYDMPVEEMEEFAKKKAAEKLSLFQDRLTKDIQSKIQSLKQQQAQSLEEAREGLRKEETSLRTKLSQDMEKRMEDFKSSLEEQYNQRCQVLRNEHERALADLVTRLDDNFKAKSLELTTGCEKRINEIIQREEERYSKETKRLESEADERIARSAEIIKRSVDQIKANEESEIMQVKKLSDNVIDELKKKFEDAISELEEKHQADFRRLEEEHNASLIRMRSEKEAELKRVETEWEDKIMASGLQHKASLESAVTEHDRSIASFRQQFLKEEEELKKKHSEQIEAWNVRVRKVTEKLPNDITQINRDFEKMRCEKRLLEDKYRSLKDKYVQLKSDMRVAVERKLQSRARRKREEQLAERNDNKPTVLVDGIEDGISKPRNYNNNNGGDTSGRNLTVPTDPTDNDPSSTDDQYNSLSSAPATESEPHSKQGGGRIKRRGGSKGRSSGPGRENVLEAVKSQLHELEQIEERIPATAHTDTYVRYPFIGPGLRTTAEVDFYRHRVLVEQEAVRAARECLLQQKRELETRQTNLRASHHDSAVLHQQEQDLTEMEVSLHRTRALLGEKMIRLRLLGQTLDRLVNDPNAANTSDTSPQGVKEEGSVNIQESIPFNVLQNLENINCEIREIWAHLSKHQYPGSPPLMSYRVVGAEERRDDVEAVVSPGSLRRSTIDRSALEERLHQLRQWLDQPRSQPQTTL